MVLFHQPTFLCAHHELQDWHNPLGRSNTSLQLVNSAHVWLQNIFPALSFLGDLMYSSRVCLLTVSQIYIYMHSCSREMNKCSSQSAFSRTFALLMSFPPCCVRSSPVEQHGKWGKDRRSESHVSKWLRNKAGGRKSRVLWWHDLQHSWTTVSNPHNVQLLQESYLDSVKFLY